MKKFMDSIIEEIDKGLRYSIQDFQTTKRECPGKSFHDDDLMEIEKNHSASLMRVNHSGEVCAQALYRGQALTAKLNNTRDKMESAAEEELDHLAWCNERLNDLNAKPSFLNPLWYGLSFSLGAVAGLAGDKWSLGFVKETEDQVVKHLSGHLENVSTKDKKTMAIINKMRADEEKHSKQALESGAAELPKTAKKSMSMIAKLMTISSYRF